MTLDQPPPPGWYLDPYPPPGVAPALRFWDGQQWTEHLAPPPLAAPTVAAPYVGQPPAPEPTTPDGVPLAGWWPRVAAQVIDGLIVGAAGSVFAFPLQLRMQADMRDLMESEPDPSELLSAYLDLFLPLFMWTGLISFVCWAVYSSIMLRRKGATVGKLALGLEVRLRERPGQLPWSTIATRILVQQGYLLTAVLPLLYLALSWYPLLDCLWATWDKKRQTLHDKAARTNVVRIR